MTARGEPRRDWHRVGCLLAAVLCALGVFSGAVLRTSDTGQHRSPAAAIATSIADGHGSSARVDHHLIATAAVSIVSALRSKRAVPTPFTSAPDATIDVIRTRGPPVLA